MYEVKIYIEYIARGMEIIGVATIVIGVLISLARFIFTLQHIQPRNYKVLRKELGKSILLGLEILVAGDIIATVVTEPTLDRVIILGIIIIIRTFLSLSIEVEIEGRFPWQKKLREQEAQ